MKSAMFTSEQLDQFAFTKVKEAIAARDKEWVAKGNELAEKYPSAIFIWQWQQLKKDMVSQ